MESWYRKALITALSIVLCFYTIIFVNFPVLQPQSALAAFIMFGLVLCFLNMPAFKWLKHPVDEDSESTNQRFVGRKLAAQLDIATRLLFAILTLICFGYIFVQTEPVFSSFWPSDPPFTGPTSLGNRAEVETSIDFVIAVIGLILVLEATRRTIGWIVPALALLFILYAYFGASLPDWLLPHQGKSIKQICCTTCLQSLGILGPAARVMFTFVFLFVVFGAFLEMSGATQFIIDFSQRLFGRSAGGPAKVSVIGSGLMGSLSGSAVANAVTTGSFTIPMMRSAGFQPTVAGGITAAAATGGALVPPVMGAGAYMMLEFVKRPAGQPEVTFLEIAKAAMIPAFLYYFSLFMIVHFFARRMGVESDQANAAGEMDNKTSVVDKRQISAFEGLVFFGALGLLVGLLIMGFSPFKSVTGSLVLILFLSIFRKQSNLTARDRQFAGMTFFGTIIAHQLTMFSIGTPLFTNSVFSSFLATSWIDPDTGWIGGRQVFESLLRSSFMGMIGLLIFGLQHSVWRPQVVGAFKKAAAGGIPLVAASACVGIIIGVVQMTPIANEFGEAIKSVIESNLLLALIGIMFCSIVLGMGVPSVVCYLLMATLMGSLLSELEVDPLAAHLFIFYYGMMSMVTPPVALAAYASASIAEAPIMRTALASFRFSLVGFTLPFMFIYRPALLLMGPVGEPLVWYDVLLAVVASVMGVIALAAGLTGFLRNHLTAINRVLLMVSAALLLAPNLGGPVIGLIVNLVGAIILIAIGTLNRNKSKV